MSELVSYEIRDAIGIVSVDNPPVNALSHLVRVSVVEAVEKAQHDTSRALVLICKGRTFFAGADIKEFGQAPKSPSLPDMLGVLESSRKPIIAALHGTALGGGFETALACHYRCALSSAKVGLPEVKLGLLPGAGGTQRTPRLAGAEAALELMTSGKPIPAEKATSLNFIDHIIEGDELLEGALNYAGKLLAEDAPLRKVRDLKTSSPSEGFFEAAEAKLAKRARGQLAPQKILECVQAAATLEFEKGLEFERNAFIECLNSPQSAALRHVFFAERQTSKIPSIDKNTPTRPINSVGIIGAGTMGGGIAMNFANVGIPVTLLELNEEALTRGLGTIQKNYERSVKKGRLSQDDLKNRMDLIGTTTSYDDLKDVDLVIEAVFENPDVKKEVFAKLDEVCKPGVILATNTSYQNIDDIAAVTKRPEDVLGLHFFSPANVMKLLEVVRTDKTADDVIATAMKLAKTIRKVPVLARVCYGFIGNRMFQPYMRTANMLLLEGTTPDQIDRAAYDFGMAMGPIAVADLAGIDIGVSARRARNVKDEDPLAFLPSDLMYEQGRYGQKTGAGFYTYDPETRERKTDESVAQLIREVAQKRGVEQKPFSDEDIVERLIYSLVNEGANILDEGIALRPGDIDIAYIYGYGFPAHRGGPMFYADSVGLKTIVERMKDFQEGIEKDYWQPSPLLKRLAHEGTTFAEWQKDKA